MNLQYIEYENELKSFYQISTDYRNGRCFQIYGLPGAGLNHFVDSFIRRYGDGLKSEKHIYCCVIQCPKDHPKTLFIQLMQKIAETLIHAEEQKKSSGSQQQNLDRLSELIRYGNCLERENDTGLNEIENYVIDMADICSLFADEVNIRIFIKNFDRSSKLFEQNINYAMLFKEISENYSNWLGIAITIHRTLAVIALKIEAFSEFATLYDPFPIKGFNESQLEMVFHQMESVLQFALSRNAREQIKYFCGGNPKRLEILFTAMRDLHLKMPAELWSETNGEEFIRQSFHCCNVQMQKHLERIMRCVNDLPGDGARVLREALFDRQSEYDSSVRNLLFEMQILTSSKEAPYITTTIPILADEVKQMEKKVSPKQEGMYVLHLSDLHFRSDEDADGAELRKQYIYRFFEKLTAICRTKPIQYIFITGDIGYKALEGDYDQAEKFITNILKVCRLDAKRLFLCPGNHDVDRSSIEDYLYPSEQKAADKVLTLEKLEKQKEHFWNYNLLCGRLGCLHYHMKDNENYLTGVRFCEDCTVVSVNTASFSKEDKMKKVWVGKNYPVAIKNKIDETYDNDSSRKELPVIAIMHHPVAYWEEQDCTHYDNNINVWEMITKMSDVILCGHTHETSDAGHTFDNMARICHGGAFYQEYTYGNSFYIYELKNKKCRKIQYRWIGERWLEDSEN